MLRQKSDSDTQELVSFSPVMKESLQKAHEHHGMMFAVTDQESLDTVEKNKSTIGSTTFDQVLSEKRNVNILALDRVAPNAESFASGK